MRVERELGERMSSATTSIWRRIFIESSFGRAGPIVGWVCLESMDSRTGPRSSWRRWISLMMRRRTSRAKVRSSDLRVIDDVPLFGGGDD